MCDKTKRTLRTGPAQLDGAHKCRKWHFIDIPVLRRAQRHRLCGSGSGSSWELRPVPIVSCSFPYFRRPYYFLGIVMVAYGGGRSARRMGVWFALGAVRGFLGALRCEEVFGGGFE